MSYQIMVCLDIDEMGGTLSPEQFKWVVSEDRVNRAITELTRQWPNTTINVYYLQQQQKLKTPPTYQRYKVSSNGEILPV